MIWLTTPIEMNDNLYRSMIQSQKEEIAEINKQVNLFQNVSESRQEEIRVLKSRLEMLERALFPISAGILVLI